jgi:hypothetical protein
VSGTNLAVGGIIVANGLDEPVVSYLYHHRCGKVEFEYPEVTERFRRIGRFGITLRVFAWAASCAFSSLIPESVLPPFCC